MACAGAVSLLRLLYRLSAAEANAKASPHFTVIPLAHKNPNFEARTNSYVMKVNLDSRRKRAVSVTYLDAGGREFEQPADLVISGGVCLRQRASDVAFEDWQALYDFQRNSGSRGPQAMLINRWAVWGRCFPRTPTSIRSWVRARLVPGSMTSTATTRISPSSDSSAVAASAVAATAAHDRATSHGARFAALGQGVGRRRSSRRITV